MTTIVAAASKTIPPYIGPHGNAWIKTFKFDQAVDGLPAAADVVRLGVIPAGVEVQLARFKGDDCGGATIDLGYTPVDGSNPAASASYWWNDLDTSGQATNEWSAADPIKFEYDVYLDMLVNTTAMSGGTAQVHVTLIGENKGTS